MMASLYELALMAFVGAFVGAFAGVGVWLAIGIVGWFMP